SQRVLRLLDDSATSAAAVNWIGASAPRKTLEFALDPVALPNGFLFDVRGVDSSQQPVQSYHFAIHSNGDGMRYTASTARWEPLAPAGTVPVGRSSTFRVEAGLDRATLMVNGTVVGTATPTAPGAVALNGHAFSSAGTAPVGDQVLIDDVYFR